MAVTQPQFMNIASFCEKLEKVRRNFPQAMYKFNPQHLTLDIWSSGQTEGQADIHLAIDSCNLWMLDSIKME